MHLTKAQSLREQPAKAKENKTLDVLKVKLGTMHGMQEQKLKVFFYGQTQWRVPVKVIKTGPLKQDEFFKWAYDPDFPLYKSWSYVDFLLRTELQEEREYNRRMGNLNFRPFDKKTFKPEPHSQKLIEEDVARRRQKRPQSILAAEGMIRRGTYPRHLSQKGSEFIVVNGVFPDEDIRPIPVVRIETLT
jgi:hypothetical protein